MWNFVNDLEGHYYQVPPQGVGKRVINFLSLLSLAIATACAHQAREPSSSKALKTQSELPWCRQPGDGVSRHWESISDPHVEVVPAAQLPIALVKLRGDSAIKLSAAQTKAFLGREAGTTSHYLVRAGVAAPPDRDIESVVQQAQSASFELSWSPQGNMLSLITINSLRGPYRYYDIAVIIATELPIRQTHVYCLAVS